MTMCRSNDSATYSLLVELRQVAGHYKQREGPRKLCRLLESIYPRYLRRTVITRQWHKTTRLLTRSVY